MSHGIQWLQLRNVQRLNAGEKRGIPSCGASRCVGLAADMPSHNTKTAAKRSESNLARWRILVDLHSNTRSALLHAVISIFITTFLVRSTPVSLFLQALWAFADPIRQGSRCRGLQGFVPLVGAQILRTLYWRRLLRKHDCVPALYDWSWVRHEAHRGLLSQVSKHRWP